ncbi:MAG TPA: DMT family transporter [Niabella sp.]|nr:DMT family transporter [Niabella sp.]HOZ97811.1 DMT family transporter [Niabella sp.]HQW15650.1 DMT family transporter [Niabella sp.]HQX20833.1 DMT family transporter [Niabella sp.]HQX42083.1 DMT family transporter [Niabella sp.]
MRKSFLQLHLAVFLAGFTGVLGRLITLNEGLIVWYRLLITAATLWVIYLLTNKMQKIALKDILQLTGVGFLSALHWVFFYGSIKYGNVSIALVCFSAISFFSSFLEPLVNRVRINKIELLFGLMNVLGIWLIFHFDTRYKTGIILGIVAAFLGALFPILLKVKLKYINTQTVLNWQLTGGFITLSLAMPFYLKAFPVASLIPSLSDFLWLLVLSWLCSVIAFQFSMYALKKLSAFTVNLSYGLEPVYGILMAFIIYKENQALNMGFYLGFGIILLTLVLHTILLRREHKLSQINENANTTQ